MLRPLASPNSKCGCFSFAFWYHHEHSPTRGWGPNAKREFPTRENRMNVTLGKKNWLALSITVAAIFLAGCSTSSSHLMRRQILAAAAVDDMEKVKALLNGNPDLAFSKDDLGATPLHYVAGNDHKDVAELLLADKADVNAKDDTGWTPLHWAALEGHKGMAELLLANKADVNAKDNKGYTPLYYAADKGHQDVVELLRQHGGHE